MLKTSASIVLGIDQMLNVPRGYASASSLAAALLDSPFEHRRFSWHAIQSNDRSNTPCSRLEKINAYYGESHILRDVSFTIDSGEVVCLMGRNGVGKTTTLKVLTGLLPARSGRVMFDGADVTKEATDGRARRGLAYVPQGREILPHLTVRENLLLGFWARSDKPNGTVEKTVFDEVYHLFPKLTQILNRPGGVLSGGEQQQLAIGRAILSNPKVLLLDEPTEGIQPSIVDQIEDVIIGFKNSRRFGILLVEQGLHFAARLAEKYVVMAKGAVVVSGKSNELSADMVKKHLTV